MVVIEHIVLTIHYDPGVTLRAVWIVVVLDHGACDSGIESERFAVTAKRNHFIARCISIAEYQARNDEVLAAYT